MVVALVLNYIGINPMHFLYLAAILNGLTAPILMLLVWLLARDSKLMGEWRSKPWSQLLLLGATALMISLPMLWLIAA
jgi:Mn2+/Fe2+ NRAMP family transporter